MSGKILKNRKQTKTEQSGSQRAARILFAIFAVILILSMVLSTFANF